VTDAGVKELQEALPKCKINNNDSNPPQKSDAGRGGEPDAVKLVKKELAKLQGEWTMVSLEENGKKESDETVKRYKLTIKEDQWIITTSMGGGKKPFKIDPSKDPKTLDLVFKFGDKETVSPGIYKLEGDTLTLCRSTEKAGRPKEFKIRNNGDVLVVWKRVKK